MGSARPTGDLSIEGIPFIIRFKTSTNPKLSPGISCIEGIPFIIRFKTVSFHYVPPLS